MKTIRPKKCEICEIVFRPRSGATKLCDNCKSPICVGCGTKITNPHIIKTKPQKYCTSKCYLKHRWGKTHYERRLCDWCGKGIVRLRCEFQFDYHFCGHYCRTKFYWNDPISRAKIIAGIDRDAARERRLKQRLPTRMTSIEIKIKEELDRRKIEYQMHRTMFKKWQPDFVLLCEPVIICADGDYWHNLPHAIKNDTKFDITAVKAGWAVFRFWEKEIHADVVKCIDQVEQYLQAEASRVSRFL